MWGIGVYRKWGSCWERPWERQGGWEAHSAGTFRTQLRLHRFLGKQHSSSALPLHFSQAVFVLLPESIQGQNANGTRTVTGLWFHLWACGWGQEPSWHLASHPSPPPMLVCWTLALSNQAYIARLEVGSASNSALSLSSPNLCYNLHIRGSIRISAFPWNKGDSTANI